MQKPCKPANSVGKMPKMSLLSMKGKKSKIATIYQKMSTINTIINTPYKQFVTVSETKPDKINT